MCGENATCSGDKTTGCGGQRVLYSACTSGPSTPSYRPSLAFTGHVHMHAPPRSLTLWQNDEDSHMESAQYSDSEDTNKDVETIDEDEVYDLIRSITDPELPYSLEHLAVVSRAQVRIKHNTTQIEVTPTRPHCSAVSFIGLAILLRLQRTLPARFRVEITIKEGSYEAPASVTKQLNDKERVAAALESVPIMTTLESMLLTAHLRGTERLSNHSHGTCP